MAHALPGASLAEIGALRFGEALDLVFDLRDLQLATLRRTAVPAVPTGETPVVRQSDGTIRGGAELLRQMLPRYEGKP